MMVSIPEAFLLTAEGARLVAKAAGDRFGGTPSLVIYTDVAGERKMIPVKVAT